MSESREVIKQRIKNGELTASPVPPKPKQKSLLSSILTYPWEMIKIFLGIDKDSLNKPTTPKQQFPQESPSIRDTYRVNPSPSNNGINPYTFNPVEYDNLRIYLQGQDGKGDPPKPHQCDHEH